MARRSKLSQALRHYSMGMVDSLANFILCSMYFGLDAFTPKMWEKELYQPGFQAIDDLIKVVDQRTIWRSIYHLKRQRLVDYVVDRQKIQPRWTKLGKQRIKGMIPDYQVDRPWNGRTYLVTYDIDEEDKKLRDKFREYLKTIKSVPLQASVYFSVPDPRKLVDEFVRQHSLSFEVLVSDLGRSGAIGKQTLPELVADVYQLDGVNFKYRHFLKNFSLADQGDAFRRAHAGFGFLSILQDDPQLPFELLPDDWAGDEAHQLYQKICLFKKGRR